MATENVIQIEIQVDGKRALASLDLTQDGIKALGAQFVESKRDARTFGEETFVSLNNVRVAVQALEGAWRAFSGIFGANFSLYERQIIAEVRLESVLKATGRQSEITAQQLGAQASALQQLTTVGDEAILETQAVLLTFNNLGTDILPRVTEAALDLSAVLGGDLRGNALRLARALDDPANALESLRRTGVTFTEDQRQIIDNFIETGQLAEAQAVILTELESRFQGVSRAIAETPAGRFRQLQNELGDVREEIGGLLATGLLPFVEGTSGLLQLLNEIDPRLVSIVSLTGTLGTTLIALNVTGLLPVIRNALTWQQVQRALVAQNAASTASVLTLAGGFRTLGIAVRGFLVSLGPLGLLTVGLTALIPLFSSFARSNRDSAAATNELTSSLDNLLATADDVRFELAGQELVAAQLQRRLQEARQELLRARGRENRREAVDEVKRLQAEIDALNARIENLDQRRIRLEAEERNQAIGPLSPEQTRQRENLRIELIADAQERELAQLRIWYNDQVTAARRNAELLELIELAYQSRRDQIVAQAQERALAAERTFAERRQAIAEGFLRLQGTAEIDILADRLERLQSELDAEAAGTDRRRELYLQVLQARLELDRELARISEEEGEREAEAARIRAENNQEIIRQSREIFEEERRLALQRATLSLPVEERRQAELALERQLLQERKAILEDELRAVEANTELTADAREREANAIIIQLLRVKQAIGDVDAAAPDLGSSFTDTTLEIVRGLNQIFSAFGDLFSSLNTLYRQDAERKIQAETRKRTAALDTAEQEALANAQSAEERIEIEQAYEERRAALEEEMLEKKAEAARKFFLLQQIASIGQATMSTYEAATRALTLPPPFGQILAGVLTAAGLANVAVIASQQPPAFADGGLFRGQGGPRDDANLARLSDGEFIVNAASTSRYRDLLEAINTNRLQFNPMSSAPAAIVATDSGINARQVAGMIERGLKAYANRPLNAVARVNRYETAAIIETGTTQLSDRLTFTP